MAYKTHWIMLATVAIAITIQPVRQPSSARPAPAAAMNITLSLSPSRPSPQSVGTPITWTATPSPSKRLFYRFGVASVAMGPFTVLRDFSPHHSVVWAPLDEGTYYVQVTAKVGYTATATVSTTVAFTLSSRVTSGQPVISATANPLVALYSAPACDTGTGSMYVAFQQVGSATWQQTNAEPCVTGQSRNFLVAGMLQNTPYQMVNVISGTTIITSTPLTYTTGSISSSLIFPTFTDPVLPGPQTDTAQGIVLHVYASVPFTNQPSPVATDLQGNIVWYANERDLNNHNLLSGVWAVRYQPVASSLGSTIFVLGNDSLQQNGEDVLREIDLAGNPVQETNVQAINAQLLARGDEIIYGFHHDATVLPNGDIAVLGQTQQVITTTPVMGDMLVVLDPATLQVVWTWDAFHFLNPYRGPTLGERCARDPPGYCAVPGGPSTIDWLHTNTIAWSPADDNIVLSMRHQDWLVKINYANGAGDGAVLWRLGPGGDFTIVPLSKTDPYPWFSHQHDLNYIDDTTIELFDNGNTRCAALPPPCLSRGQVYSVDEQTKVATQLLNVDVGVFSAALGTAQQLANGDYNFTAGFVLIPQPDHSQDIEVLPNGTQVFVQQLNGTEYRAWRLATLYSPI